jgi:hypothetical protein
VSADPLAVHVPGKADDNVYAYVSGKLFKAIDVVGLIQFEVSTWQALFGGGGLKTATREMTGRMQSELMSHFGIATTRTNDWNGSDLNLAGTAAQDTAKAAAEDRMRKAGATDADIAKWNVARSRMVEWVGSDRVVDMSTTDRKGGPLIGGETNTTGGVKMNPYTWFNKNGTDISKGSSPGAKTQMGPAVTLLHETDHVHGCMSGSQDCQNNIANQWNTHVNSEQTTTEDVNNSMKADKDITPRPDYSTGANRPGGDIQLGNGESYSYPSAKQLEEGQE